jgi:ankyrin repeat protein
MRRREAIAASLLAAVTGGAGAAAYDDFFRAVGVDDARTVGELLARGFDPNSVNERGDMALIVALRADSPKVAALLIASPALKVDATNAAGETALMIAALRGQHDWARRLVERGARVNRDGWTPLHYAASGPEPKVVALLLDPGGLLDAPSPNHSTPLMMAARYGAEAGADLLLARGADPTVRNDKALNAADFARAAGRDALAERLQKAAEKTTR